MSLDGDVCSDGSSSGGSSSLNSSDVDGDRDGVLLVGNHVCLSGFSSFEASGFAPLDGGSVSFTPFDVLLASSDSDLESRAVMRPGRGESLLARSHAISGELESLDGGGVGSSSSGTGMESTFVGVSCNRPCGESSASLDLHGELMGKGCCV